LKNKIKKKNKKDSIERKINKDVFFKKKKPDPVGQPWNLSTDSLSSLDLKLTHLLNIKILKC
jgi:hypothetical protein